LAPLGEYNCVLVTVQVVSNVNKAHKHEALKDSERVNTKVFLSLVQNIYYIP